MAKLHLEKLLSQVSLLSRHSFDALKNALCTSIVELLCSITEYLEFEIGAM